MIFTDHFVERMRQRRITADEVMAVYTLGAPARVKHGRLRRRRSGVELVTQPINGDEVFITVVRYHHKKRR